MVLKLSKGRRRAACIVSLNKKRNEHSELAKLCLINYHRKKNGGARVPFTVYSHIDV